MAWDGACATRPPRLPEPHSANASAVGSAHRCHLLAPHRCCSPKFPVADNTEHECLPRHAVCTTAMLVGALQVLVVKPAAHEPPGVPYDAKSTDVMICPGTGHVSVP